MELDKQTIKEIIGLISFAILLSCLLGISDPEDDRRSKNVYWILLITRVIDVAIRLM